MNAYLSIAAEVFETFRIPMKGKEILARAYMNDLVPSHLHGKTQHKTLQARLSEDIRRRNEKSLFCRTKPGVFFLRKYLKDKTKEEFRARPRIRELRRNPILAIPAACVNKFKKSQKVISPSKMNACLASENARYMSYASIDSKKYFPVWSLVVVFREMSVLSFRQGQYREDRDEFVNQRTIGFASLPIEADRNLFTARDFGMVTGGVCAAAIDLDMPPTVLGERELQERAKLEFYLAFDNELVGVTTFRCPDWFEPLRRRLAINDLRWMDIRDRPNNIDDFDPWSREVLGHIRPIIEGK